MTRIQNYFNGMADKIASSSLMASTAQHRPDIGSNREDIIKNFLLNHLPKRLSASIGGQIISHDGRESGQIDIIIANDIGIRFDENDKTFVTSESVAGAITVKSTLNQYTLVDALENLESIPEPSQSALMFKTLKPGAFNAFLEYHPSRYVFAYDGIDGKKCLENIIKFYLDHPNIPFHRYPSAIVVNKCYMIRFLRKESHSSTGSLIPKNTFYLTTLDESMRGFPLVQLLNDISSYTDWLNHMDISTHPYFNIGFGLVD